VSHPALGVAQRLADTVVVPMGEGVADAGSVPTEPPRLVLLGHDREVELDGPGAGLRALCQELGFPDGEPARDLGLGTGEWPTNRKSELAYLAGRNNTKRLRQVVLDAIIEAGEIEPESAAQSNTVEDTTTKPRSQATTATFDRRPSEPTEDIRVANPSIIAQGGADIHRAGRGVLNLAGNYSAGFGAVPLEGEGRR
jgi:hypothetical protein